MYNNKTYICIDLKSFYASVECVERGLNPLTTNLVVADESRTAALLEDGYMLLKSNNNLNYLVKCPDAGDEPLVLTGTEISSNFYIMA